MRKFFTSLVVAFVAISVSAQEKVLFASDGAYGNGATLTSEHTKLVLGNDRTTKNYDLKLSTCKAYCAELFGQQVMVENSETGEMEEKTRVVYVVGNQNPKDGELDGDKSTGSGYKPENGNLPQSGTYYMITPSVSGHITAFVILNSGKNFYIVKSSGENLPLGSFTIKADGEEGSEVTVNDDYTLDEKTTGTVEFDVVGGETYYVFCTGSKLSFGGYVFKAEGDEPQPGGLTDPALPVTFNDWSVSFLIQKTDVKAGDKFVFTCEAVDVEGWEWGPQVLPKSNADWSDLGPALIPGADGKATFNITEDYAAVINGNGGLRVQGMGVKVTDVEYVEGTAPGPGDGWVELVKNGDVEGQDGTSLLSKNGDGDGGSIFNPVAGAGIDGSTAAVVHAVSNAVNEWDSQFFIYAPDHVFTAGEQYKVSFWVRADKPTSVSVQAHKGVGEYLHWCVITNGEQVNITTEWTEVKYEGTVSAEQEGMQTIAFNLNQDKTLENNYYFDNISWQVAATDGINDMKVVRTSENAPIYNLAGVRVSKDYKGIVIQNGRKFVQK